MKIININDLHLRPTAPLNRKDDYVEAQFRKLDYIIDYVNKVDGMLVIGGDVFDRAINHPSWFLNRVMGAFLMCDEPIHIIPGNHDLLGHNLEKFGDNTLSLLTYALVWGGVYHDIQFAATDNTLLTFVPFGADTEHVRPRPGAKNILVVHEPVFEDTVPFYMPDALTVDQLEAKYPGFDLYIAGDIHIPCQKSKTLVSGSMMRMTTAQKDHRPQFFVIDSETLEVTVEYLPIEQDVWKLESEVVVDDGFKAELKDLAIAMSERGEMLDYSAVCERLSGEDWPVFDKLIQEYKEK